MLDKIKKLEMMLYAETYVNGSSYMDDLPVWIDSPSECLFPEEIARLEKERPAVYVPNHGARHRAAVKLDKIYRTEEDRDKRTAAAEALARYYSREFSLWQMIRLYFTKSRDPRNI